MILGGKQSPCHMIQLRQFNIRNQLQRWWQELKNRKLQQDLNYLKAGGGDRGNRCVTRTSKATAGSYMKQREGEIPPWLLPGFHPSVSHQASHRLNLTQANSKGGWQMGFATSPVRQSRAGEGQGMSLRAGRQITSSLPVKDADWYHA